MKLYRDFKSSKYDLSANRIKKIMQDRRGFMWFATHNGLSRYDGRRFKIYKHDPLDPNSLSSNVLNSVVEDYLGFIWIGGVGGLNRFDSNTGKFVRYRHNPDDPNSPSSNDIMSVYFDRLEIVWIGTYQNGLPDDIVRNLLMDDKGNLWLGTNNGISRFNPVTETFRNYDVSDGLQDPSFSYAYKGHNGQMFFAGNNGFNIFYPDHIKDSSYIPPVVLTDLKQGGLDMDSGRYSNLPGGTYLLKIKGSNNDGVWNEEGSSIKIAVITICRQLTGILDLNDLLRKVITLARETSAYHDVIVFFSDETQKESSTIKGHSLDGGGKNRLFHNVPNDTRQNLIARTMAEKQALMISDFRDAHGGGIEVESKEGVGTTVTLWLPYKGTA